MERRRRERRQGKDVLTLTLTVIGYINAGVVITMASLFSLAKPDAFHSMYQELPLKYYWDEWLFPYILALSVFGLMVSTIGLIINAQRLKRKTDSIRAHLIVVAIISMAGIIFYLVA